MKLYLPPPLEPVEIDLDRPLEEQLSGEQLEAAKKMLEMVRKSMELGMRNK